jgi:hypothetical protein
MSLNLKMQANTLVVVVPKEITTTGLVDCLEKAGNDVLDEHRESYAKALDPADRPQKALSAAYAEAKNAGKVWVDGRYRGGKPIANLLLTKAMLGSLDVKRIRKGVELIFGSATQAKKAAHLKARGFRLHFLSRKNQLTVDRVILNECVEPGMKKAFTVRKKTLT